MSLYTSLARGAALVACIGAGACGPCTGFLSAPSYGAPGEAGGPVLNGAGVKVGMFLQAVAGSPLTFDIMRSQVQEPPGALTYELEVYDGQSPCPPDPRGKLASRGSAKDSSPTTGVAGFEFSKPGLTKEDLLGLNDKILVLRALNQAAEPTVGVICTQTLIYADRVFEGCHD